MAGICSELIVVRAKEYKSCEGWLFVCFLVSDARASTGIPRLPWVEAMGLVRKA